MPWPDRPRSADPSGRAPFFVWLHLYDPHEPYRAPPPFGPAFTDSPYDGEVAFTDAIVASILDKLSALGLLGSTIVAVIGDHGESLGDHGEETHSMFVYDSAMRVPFLLWRPGRLPAGLVVRQPVRAIDLPWTLAELVGVPPPKTPHSRSLVPLIEGRGGQASEPVYAETYLPELYMNWAPLRALRDDRWKLIDAPRPELYDLATDAGETQNLYDREPQTAAAIRRALDRLAGDRTQPVKGVTLDRETLDKLAALGYVGAGAEPAPRVAGQTLADPKDMIGLFNRLRRANSAVRDRRFSEALPVLQDVLREDPKNAFATLVLGSAYLGMEQYPRAILQYRRYLRTGADERKRAPVDRDLPYPARAAGPGTEGSGSGPGDRSPLLRRTHPARGHSREPAAIPSGHRGPSAGCLSGSGQADDQARSREGPGRGRPPG